MNGLIISSGSERSDQLKYHSEQLADRLEIAFSKFHQAYGLERTAPEPSAKISFLSSISPFSLFTRLGSSRRNSYDYESDIRIETIDLKESYGVISCKKDTEERYFALHPQIVRLAKKVGLNIESGIYVSENFQPSTSPHIVRDGYAEWRSYRNRDIQVIRLDEITGGFTSSRAAENITKNYMMVLNALLEKGTITFNKNAPRINDAAELLSALIQDPSLKPDDFFNGFTRRRREKIDPLDLPLPDVLAAREKLQRDIEDIKGNTKTNALLFGNDEAMASSQASMAVSDWQIRNAMTPPLSFHYMKQISKIVSEIVADNGSMATLLEKDSTGEYTSEIAEKLRQIAAIGRKTKDEIPKDLKIVEEQAAQEERAREVTSAHAEITDMTYTMFREELPTLKGLEIGSNHKEPRYSAASLDMKAQTLLQTRLIAMQKQVALQSIHAPIKEALMLSLPQMMNDVDRLIQFSARVHERIVMARISNNSQNSAAFASATQGVKINSSQVERFKSMSVDEQRREITRNLRQLQNVTQKWDSTVSDVEQALLAVEDEDAPRLLLTDERNSIEELVIRLQTEEDPIQATNVVPLDNLVKDG